MQQSKQSHRVHLAAGSEPPLLPDHGLINRAGAADSRLHSAVTVLASQNVG